MGLVWIIWISERTTLRLYKGLVHIRASELDQEIGLVVGLGAERGFVSVFRRQRRKEERRRKKKKNVEYLQLCVHSSPESVNGSEKPTELTCRS